MPIIPDSSLFVRARICALYRMESIILLIAVIRMGPAACIPSSAIYITPSR